MSEAYTSLNKKLLLNSANRTATHKINVCILDEAFEHASLYLNHDAKEGHRR